MSFANYVANGNGSNLDLLMIYHLLCVSSTFHFLVEVDAKRKVF